MTNTPTHQERELREEFIKAFSTKVIDEPFLATMLDGLLERTADWWLEKRSQDLARLKGEVESLRKDWKGQSALDVPFYDHGYNEALSAVLEVIDNYQSKD